MWDGVANLCLHINGFRTSVRTSNERSCNKFFRLFTEITMAWGGFQEFTRTHADSISCLAATTGGAVCSFGKTLWNERRQCEPNFFPNQLFMKEYEKYAHLSL